MNLCAPYVCRCQWTPNSVGTEIIISVSHLMSVSLGMSIGGLSLASGDNQAILISLACGCCLASALQSLGHLAPFLPLPID